MNQARVLFPKSVVCSRCRRKQAKVGDEFVCISLECGKNEIGTKKEEKEELDVD